MIDSRVMKQTIIGVFLLMVFSVTAVSANANVLIINQVRGTSCCDVGDISNVASQIDTLEKYKLPAAFALRFDAINSEYKQLFGRHPQFELGLFLEITPDLCEAAGVVYRGPVERWYKAENSYLLGFLPVERKRLIDVAMKKFKDTFGYYPKTTVGWMIDSYSLNYLVAQYKITTHEITRDQWGTDSYTLYGGPVGPSYLPSKNWALIPSANPLSVVMVRQTISDPVWNYGDANSVFTSQPNDYLKGGKNLSYFKTLLEQALAQKPEGLAVIGLESSMSKDAQFEFHKQLEFVAKLISTNTKLTAVLPADYAVTRLTKSNLVNINAGKAGMVSSFWINTNHYRLHIAFDGNSGAAIVDDARIYGDQLIDPYAVNRPDTPNAYWIVPFTVDGSRYFKNNALSWSQKITQSLKQKLNIFDPCREIFAVRNLACVEREDGIELPLISDTESVVVLNEQLQYRTRQNQLVTLNFFDDKFEINVPSSEVLKFETTNVNIVNLNRSELFGLKHQRNGENHVFTPWIKRGANLALIQKTYQDAFVPEPIGTVADLNHSFVVSSKSIVQLNRNPMRIVVYLRDQNGRVVVGGDQPKLEFIEDSSIRVTTEHPETSLGQYYLDGFPNKVGVFTPKISLNGQVKVLSPIIVVPNCWRDFSCIKHPQNLINWVKMLLRDRLH